MTHAVNDAAVRRIAVGVSGAGSNLRALVAAARRGDVGGDVVLVFADRTCPALDWAAEEGIDTALVPRGDDATLAETLRAAAPDVVVLAGFMRIVGRIAMWKSLLTSVVFAVIMFATFEIAFDVIMPKGPIEAIFGR